MAPISETLASGRSLPSLASSFVYLGSAIGGVMCGLLAGRFGQRNVAVLGGIAVCVERLLASLGQAWSLLAGIGLGVGLLGNGALFPPIFAYVSFRFDRRRGAALALVSSEQYVAVAGRRHAGISRHPGRSGPFLRGGRLRPGTQRIVPAYALAVRALFSAAEANWRVPLLFLASLGGMAFGAWLAGVIYDKATTRWCGGLALASTSSNSRAWPFYWRGSGFTRPLRQGRNSGPAFTAPTHPIADAALR
ncbi:hypothetical protein [Cupriavidus necator]|uniref:hypothetical protein n=1 Tax=Cupriavidus necator TaxID=106590 RepID=UPI003F738F67